MQGHGPDSGLGVKVLSWWDWVLSLGTYKKVDFYQESEDKAPQKMTQIIKMV